MAYVITELCVGTCDTACVEVCPVDCIHGPLALDAIRALDAGERELSALRMFIDPEQCICCAHCVSECPVEAIVDEDDLPPHLAADRERNTAFFRNTG